MSDNQTIKDRIKSIISYYNLSVKQFEESIGVSNGYVNSIKNEIGSEKLRKILEVYPEINVYWLLTGDEKMSFQQNKNMIMQHNTTNSIINTGNNSNIKTESNPFYQEINDTSEINPIIPSTILRTPNLDVMLYVRDNINSVEHAPIKLINIKVDLWLRLIDNSLAPKYAIGDLLALIAYPQGTEEIVPGEPYVIDTKSNGVISRILLKDGQDSYIAHSANDDYPEFYVKKSDIFRLYKIVFSVRL